MILQMTTAIILINGWLMGNWYVGGFGVITGIGLAVHNYKSRKCAYQNEKNKYSF